MARIRSVHPGQWTDDEFVCCSPLARLLVIGLRNEADDNGIFEWNPVKLKMRLLPADNCDVADLLEEAVANNQVAMYEVGGKRFGIVRNFHRFQKIKAPTYIYPIPEVLPKGYRLNPAYSGSPTEIPALREEGRGKREETPRAPDGARAGFDRFWSAYPKKKSKGDARKAWKSLKPNEQLQDRILRALERAKTSDQWRKDAGQFIPYPATWLRAEGWEDEVQSPRRADLEDRL